MDEIGLNELLQIIIRDKGGTSADYHQLMDYIAYHETGPVDPSVPDQRMKPDAQQYEYDKKLDKYVPSGTGKGLFMFESHEDAGGNTAANRLANILSREGIEKPQWLIDIWKNKKSVDASKLSADQQKMLFLAYHRDHEHSDFSELWSGKKQMPQWWGDYHWAGDKEKYASKVNDFILNMTHKDSVEAVRAKKEELMYKQNMAPYLSDSNNIDKLPTEKNISDIIFGEQESSLIKDWDKGARANPQSEFWEGRPNPYRHAGAKVTTNPIELAVMGGGSLLKKLLLSSADKSGIVDKGHTSKQSGKKVLKKTAETFLKNVDKNPFVRQNLENRIEESRGKELNWIQKKSDDLFLSRKFLNKLLGNTDRE